MGTAETVVLLFLQDTQFAIVALEFGTVKDIGANPCSSELSSYCI